MAERQIGDVNSNSNRKEVGSLARGNETHDCAFSILYNNKLYNRHVCRYIDRSRFTVHPEYKLLM